MSTTESRKWHELFPDGRIICYEGDQPDAFAETILREFGFDPRNDPRWDHSEYQGDDEWWRSPRDLFGRTLFFHCPAEYLDAIYSDRFPMGS